MSASNSSPIVTFGSAGEGQRRSGAAATLRASPIPDEELLANLGLFLTPQTLSRILFMDFLYRQVLEVQGVVMEFGCRWGQNLALFQSLRGVYEPFNRLRKIIGFDTFGGFPSVAAEDGSAMHPNQYGTAPGYESFLERILTEGEKESPLEHLKKFEVIKGNVTGTLPAYLERNPETIISLAYFDLDLYEPTLACLNLIRDRITIGTVLGFDELNEHAAPGETLALRQALGLERVAVKRHRYNARCSYVVIGQ